jgi:hypothetical protein
MQCHICTWHAVQHALQNLQTHPTPLPTLPLPGIPTL